MIKIRIEEDIEMQDWVVYLPINSLEYTTQV